MRLLLALVLALVLFFFHFPVESNEEITSVQVATSTPSVEPAKTHEFTSKDEIIDYVVSVAKERGIAVELFKSVMLKESGASSTIVGDQHLICKDGPYKGLPIRSRGIWQINQCAWPDITDEQAFDVVWSTNWAADRFKEGRADLWTTWRQ